METIIYNDRKIAALWLSHSDMANPELEATLKPLYAKFKKCGYTVVVFRSGTRDLAEETSELLRYNRRRAARREDDMAR